VRQVGYLQELNRDARSTEYKILQSLTTVMEQNGKLIPDIVLTF